MKLLLIWGVPLVGGAYGGVQAAGVHQVWHADDLAVDPVYTLQGQQLQVKGRVQTDTPFLVVRDSVLNIEAGAVLELRGKLSNPEGAMPFLEKTGSGSLVLAGVSELTSNFIVREGTLRVAHEGSLGWKSNGISLYPGTRLEYLPGLRGRGQLYFQGIPSLQDRPIQWEVATGRAVQIADIHGQGHIQKTGAGHLEWPSELRSNFSGYIDIQEGSFSLGTSATAWFSLQANTAFVGLGGSVQGLRLEAHSQFWVGQGRPRRFTVRRQFSMAPASTLIMRLWPNGEHDYLYTDQAQLAGLLALELQDGDWSQAARYTVIESTQAIRGQFDHSQVNRSEVATHLDYKPNAVSVVLTPGLTPGPVAPPLIPRPKAPAATTPRSLAHPYNAIDASVLDDIRLLGQWQQYKLRQNPDQSGWIQAQHRGQHHLRLAGQDALARHGEWLGFGGQVALNPHTSVAWALATGQQRWTGTQAFQGHQTQADSVQMGVAGAQTWNRFTLQAGAVWGLHHLRHQGPWQAMGEKRHSSHVYAQLAHAFWRKAGHTVELWGQIDALKLQQGALVLPRYAGLRGTESLKLNTGPKASGQWQHSPSPGLRWNWQKSSWPMPATIMAQLGWQASLPGTQRFIQTAQGHNVVDASRYKSGGRWSWALGVEGQVGKQGALSVHYQASHSRHGGQDHGLSLSLRYAF